MELASTDERHGRGQTAHILQVFTAPVFLFYAYLAFSFGSPDIGAANAAAGAFMLAAAALAFVRRPRPGSRRAHLVLTWLSLLAWIAGHLLAFAVHGAVAFLPWALAFPLTVVCVLGVRQGGALVLFYGLLLGGAMALAGVPAGPELDALHGQSLPVFVTVALVAILLEAARVRSQRSLRASEKRLREQGALLRAESERRQEIEQQARRSLREKMGLLKEIHHRVKNNLQIVTSLMRMSARRLRGDGSADSSALRDSQSRIRTMAVLHLQLYRSASQIRLELGAYLREVCDGLVGGLDSDRRLRLVYELDEVQVNADVATPCGLIVNELVTHVARRAEVANRRVAVRVCLDDGDDKAIRLRVTSDLARSRDAGSAAAGADDGLGLRLVDRLVEQLHASQEHADGDEWGVAVRIPRGYAQRSSPFLQSGIIRQPAELDEPTTHEDDGGGAGAERPVAPEPSRRTNLVLALRLGVGPVLLYYAYQAFRLGEPVAGWLQVAAAAALWGGLALRWLPLGETRRRSLFRLCTWAFFALWLSSHAMVFVVRGASDFTGWAPVFAVCAVFVLGAGQGAITSAGYALALALALLFPAAERAVEPAVLVGHTLLAFLVMAVIALSAEVVRLEERRRLRRAEREMRRTNDLLHKELRERQEAQEVLQRSVAEKDTLLREIHHRVKNNLQLVSSLLRMAARRLDAGKVSADVALADSQSRVRSLAMLHERLYSSRDLNRIELGPYLSAIVNEQLSVARDRAVIRARFDLDDIAVGIDTAIPCGLITNELVTNALKHAFPRGRSGTIDLALRARDGSLTLELGDDGPRPPARIDLDSAETLGLRLVARLSRQLGGTVACETTTGVRFRVTVPLPREAGLRPPAAALPSAEAA